MFRVTKEIHFCYGHRLLDYDGKCRFFHGHNGKVEVELSGETLDARGMVRDFGDIKKALQSWVDDTLDHRMILNKRDPLRATLEKAGEPIYLLDENPTAENIARLIFETAQSKGLPVSSVTLWETPNAFATYSK
jgi:6-pyruvoyltetrahydropterin/6-carboxytetrahydropterin synthase